VVVACLLLGTTVSAAAAGDAKAGRKLYEDKCLSCHGDAKTEGTLGPSLIGIIGRKAGTGGGAQSRAMSESNITWDEATLKEYLAAPSEKVHGTIMPIGVPRAQDRDDLIAYIKSMR
jgi:cytochrome c